MALLDSKENWTDSCRICSAFDIKQEYYVQLRTSCFLIIGLRKIDELDWIDLARSLTLSIYPATTKCRILNKIDL